MAMKLLGAFCACAMLAACSTVPDYAPQHNAPQDGTTYKVYFLGGQSNMEGFGFTADIPDPLISSPKFVPIFQGKSVEDGKDGGGVGLWAMLQPGHGTGFDTDGSTNSYSDRFGPEFSFGNVLQARSPGEHIALIKFSRGGTALVDGVSGYGSWDPDYATGNGRNQYDNAVTTIRAALDVRDIDGDGRTDRLVPAGILWMQGEADAFDNEAAARNYAANLSRLMGLLRQEMGDPDLPVVLGRIKDSGDTDETRVMAYSPVVQSQQMQFAKSDSCARLVDDTRDFGFLPDGWHYLSADYLKLGAAFADAMIILEDRCQ